MEKMESEQNWAVCRNLLCVTHNICVDLDFLQQNLYMSVHVHADRNRSKDLYCHLMIGGGGGKHAMILLVNIISSALYIS